MGYVVHVISKTVTSPYSTDRLPPFPPLFDIVPYDLTLHFEVVYN